MAVESDVLLLKYLPVFLMYQRNAEFLSDTISYAMLYPRLQYLSSLLLLFHPPSLPLLHPPSLFPLLHIPPSSLSLPPSSTSLSLLSLPPPPPPPSLLPPSPPPPPTAESYVLDLPADTPEESRAAVYTSWRNEFLPVAQSLLTRIQTHHTHLVPLNSHASPLTHSS